MNAFSSPKQEVRNISYVLEASLGVENTAINKTNVVSAHIAHGQDARQVDFPFFILSIVDICFKSLSWVIFIAAITFYLIFLPISCSLLPHASRVYSQSSIS